MRRWLSVLLLFCCGWVDAVAQCSDSTDINAYHFLYRDTLCSGNDYHRYGFNLARQDSVGWFTYTEHYTTVQGCDSVCVLQLLVVASPTLTTLALPEEICVGQNTTVHAMGQNAGFVHPVLPVAIGDILCTDNSIVKPSAWPMEGKTAMGIVFYVDNSGSHGWAVHLQDQSSGVEWAPSGYLNDITNLTNYTNARSAINNINGYANTQCIRESCDVNSCPVAWTVGFSSGWYLPAIGQLSLLFADIVTINASLQIVGGMLFPMDSYYYYWSSTEYNGWKAWYISNSGRVDTNNKWVFSHRVRSVRSF